MVYIDQHLLLNKKLCKGGHEKIVHGCLPKEKNSIHRCDGFTLFTFTV